MTTTMRLVRVETRPGNKSAARRLDLPAALRRGHGWWDGLNDRAASQDRRRVPQGQQRAPWPLPLWDKAYCEGYVLGLEGRAHPHPDRFDRIPKHSRSTTKEGA